MNDLFKKLETAAAGQKTPVEQILDAIRFNADGLVPAIAQQHDTGEVLMQAWMNRQALLETLSTGQVCYWSRSRQQYWRKGESSGHIQKLRAMYLDCDGDSILMQVDQTGPACHTNRRSCYYHHLNQEISEIVSEPE
jgi:phosphoribosyl-AMP cyclohydrolase